VVGGVGDHGLLAAAVLIRSVIPGSLQARADLVELHAVLELIGAVVAPTDRGCRQSVGGADQSAAGQLPSGWVLRPEHQQVVRSAQPVGTGPSPSPTTEPVSGTGSLTTMQIE